ncbi:MAG: type II secretion system protein M [Deltaproteobacteria bacterium]|nr:type II secretion system protein M [Deltaproteobacteria bacterium]
MFDRLQPRERALIIAMAAVLVITALFMFVHVTGKKRRQLADRIQQASTDVEMIYRIGNRLTDIEATIGNIKLPSGTTCDRNLYGSIESLARREGITDLTIRPLQSQENDYLDEQSVEIEVRKVPLVNLVNFLYAIDRSPQAYRAWRFNVRRRFDDANLLDSRFQVSLFCGKQQVPEGGG